MTGAFYSVSTLLNQMVVTHYEVSFLDLLCFFFFFLLYICRGDVYYYVGAMCAQTFGFLYTSLQFLAPYSYGSHRNVCLRL